MGISPVSFPFLQASLDEPTQMVVMHHAKPSKLQCLALLLADKVREEGQEGCGGRM